MLRRLVLVPVLAVAAVTAVAPPAGAQKDVCVVTSGGIEEPRLPGGILWPREACIPIFVDLPPIE